MTTTPKREKKIKGTSNQSIHIMQWNGLNTKVNELSNRLKSEYIDMYNIQESNLQPHMPTPRIPG